MNSFVVNMDFCDEITADNLFTQNRLRNIDTSRKQCSCKSIVSLCHVQIKEIWSILVIPGSYAL